MTPNPDFPSFIRNEIPDNASIDAVAFRDIFTLLKANAASSVWHFVSEDNLTFEYNTHTGAAKIKVCFTDKNEHNHTITLRTISHEGYAEGEAIGEYLFEGTVNTDKPTFRSYAEWLMMELWNTGYDASLCKCDRGLEIPIVTECVYDLLSKMLDIVTNNIKPIEWFVSDEPIWKYYTTYHDLCLILPKLKEEAATERWKDVKPENFILKFRI